jgi:hypothetical protein
VVPVLWGVCCNLYVGWRVALWGKLLPEEPAVYVGFRWDEGVCALGVDMCEPGGFT